MLSTDAKPSASNVLLVMLMYWLNSPFNSKRRVYKARSPDPEARTSARPYSPTVKTKALMAELFTKPAASVPRSRPGQSTKAVWKRPALTETLTPLRSLDVALLVNVNPAAARASTFPAGATNLSLTFKVIRFAVLMAPPALASKSLAVIFKPPPATMLLVPDNTSELAARSMTLPPSIRPAWWRMEAPSPM